MIRWTGTLADGTPTSSASNLSLDGSWPLYLASNSGRDAVCGLLSLSGDAESDVTGTIWWFKGAKRTRKTSAAGWPGGIATEVLGSHFSASPTVAGVFASAAGGAEMPDAVNTLLKFCGGELPKDCAVRATVHGDVLSVASSDLPHLKFSIAKTTGVFGGDFPHPSGRQRTAFRGVYLQRQGIAAGYFLAGSESGEVLLTRD
jgi:hypothetical protein